MINRIIQFVNLKIFRFYGRLKARLGFIASQKTPDREVLENVIFTYISQSNASQTLFVGVDFYTKHYNQLLPRNSLTTIDFNSRLKSFGSQNHICDRYENIEKYLVSKKFDFIICNGVIGYGTDSIEALDSILLTSSRVLAEGGTLIIGWNDRPESNQFDPRLSKNISLFKKHTFLPLNTDRYICKFGSTHVYDFYKIRNNLS